ncbi:MFS transporter [Rahnella aceris]|uniref:MFS transporter n=1 Tax=Rahnella sp. (strain Y9602) TaxID=2703885 RepID=UPI001C27597C|nr:MFS transporter [Rahnella aceris]MBU9861266.1 MFS transporter [Rahnella aceris]
MYELRKPASNSQYIAVFIILALSQITGWGVIGILPVTAGAMAVDLHTTLPTIFLGLAVMKVIMGFMSPLIGKIFKFYGTRRVMSVGAVVLGCGILGVGAAQSIPLYLAAWSMLGISGAMFLTTPAYIYLADFANEGARKLIGLLMLVTGLATSIFLPLTSILEQFVGWRGAAQIYSGMLIFIVAPLILFYLPEVGELPQPNKPVDEVLRKNRIFWLLVTVIALNSFVTFGIEAVGVELLSSLGVNLVWAVTTVSFLGVFKIFGRLFDMFGGKQCDAIIAGLIAGAMIPIGIIILITCGTGLWSLTAFLFFYGVGSGAFAVSRATIPLVFYSKSLYTTAILTIALPMNLISAIAAPVLSFVLLKQGADITLMLLIFCSGGALTLLFLLNHYKNKLLMRKCSCL